MAIFISLIAVYISSLIFPRDALSRDIYLKLAIFHLRVALLTAEKNYRFLRFFDRCKINFQSKMDS